MDKVLNAVVCGAKGPKMHARRGSRRAFRPDAVVAFVLIGPGLLLLAALSQVLLPRAGHASELVSEQPAPAAVSDFQSTGENDPRRFEGSLLLSTPELAAAEPFVTLNSVSLTLPPEGQAGSVDGEFELRLEIPGPVMYVNIAGLGEAVGQAVGEAVSATTGVTADQVERSEIEVPPEYDDCVFATSIGGPLTGAGSTGFSGDGAVTTVISGSGCEDTEVALGPGGQTTSTPSSWTAILEGDRLSGSIELVDDDGDVSTILFEASLAGGAGSGVLACPAVAGFEVRERHPGEGTYQRAFVCSYSADDGGAFRISARWDFAQAPAGDHTSCGLAPQVGTLRDGILAGSIYSQSRAALVHWQEAARSGLSQEDFAALVAPLLPAAEALAAECPSVEGGTGGGGAVITPVGGTTSGGGDGGDGDVIEGGGAFTDFVVGDDGFEVSREDAAKAAAAAAGVVVLTSLILVATSGAGGADSLTDALLDQLEKGPPIGATVVDHPDFRQEGVPDAVVFDTDADGEADTLWRPGGGQVGPDTPIAEAVERLAGQPAAEAEPVGEPEPAVDEVLEVGQRSEPPSEAAAPVEAEPVAEESTTSEAVTEEEPEAAAASEAAPEAKGAAAGGAAAAAASEAAPEAGSVTASGAAAAAAVEAAPPGPPPPMTAPELAELLRKSPKAKFLEEDDIKKLARLVEDRRVEKVTIMPPFNKPIVKDVGDGWAKTDISLTNVSNTEGGVSLRLTGGVEIPVKVENGRVVLDVPDQMRRFTGAVDGYLEQLNEAFRTTGRQVEWIRKDDDSFIEIKMKALPKGGPIRPRSGGGEWDTGEDPIQVPGGIGTTG